MRFVPFFGALGFLLLVACSASPTEVACNGIIDEQCTKIFECGDKDAKDFFGGSVEECKKRLNDGYEIKSQVLTLKHKGLKCKGQTPETFCVDLPGEVFHLDMATQCAADWKATACKDYNSQYQPESCKKICQPS